MTLEEQFEKETGHIVHLSEWNNTYSDWLEEKLTWKKFSEKKPDVGSNIIYKRVIHCFCFGISENSINNVAKKYPESEWMYVPN